jgi:hypothetical protein
MMRKHRRRNRARHAITGRTQVDLGGFELDITAEELLADLTFGAGTDPETDRLVPTGRPEVGRVA